MGLEQSALAAKRVVIVEDELLVAMDIEDFLLDQECDVMATVSTAAEALEALDAHDPEIVILDLNLNGESTMPVVRELNRRKIAFVIVSGYGDLRSSDPLLLDARIVSKPWNRELLLKQLCEALPSRGQGGGH